MKKISCSFKEYERKYYSQYLACIRGFYGDGYPYGEYLDADSLDRKVAGGDLILTLAVTPEDRVISTVGAEMQRGAFEGSVVLKLRNVLDEYRGCGVSSRQLDDLLRRVGERFPDALSIYADVMTHNAVSQNSLIHRGYAFCGLRLMVYTNSVIVPYLPFPPHTKMTQAVFCRKAGEQPLPQAVLYAPPEHRAMIGKVYDRIGAGYVFRDGEPSPKVPCEYLTEESPGFSKSELIIRRCGEDLEPRLRAYFDTKAGVEDFTCVAYLPMGDPGCTENYRILEKFGFYFSGVLPLTRGGEYMILAKTDACKENFDQISLAAAPGENQDEWIPYILTSRTEGKRTYENRR